MYILENVLTAKLLTTYTTHTYVYVFIIHVHDVCTTTKGSRIVTASVGIVLEFHLLNYPSSPCSL